MRIHEMTISMVADNELRAVTVTHNSPKRIVSGARVRFGWFFMRIGARILYGKEWGMSMKWEVDYKSLIESDPDSKRKED